VQKLDIREGKRGGVGGMKKHSEKWRNVLLSFAKFC
jgi:hypothetical protein